MTLTDSQFGWLRWLDARGGVGHLDRYGRMTAMGESASQGSWQAWMNLVACGLLQGGDRRFTVTDYGKQHLSSKGPTK